MIKETNPPAPAVTTQKKDSKSWPHGIDDNYNDDAYKKSNMFHVDFLVSNFRDFARSNLFKVEFHLNKGIQSNFSFIKPEKTNIVEIMAKSFNIPSYEMGKLEVKRMGQRVMLPSSMSPGECQATFYCDDDYKQRKFLHSWFHTHVYNYETNIYRKQESLTACEIRVYQLDNKFNVIFGVSLKRAWPTSIGEIQFSHDSENQITEFPVTFTYSTYEILTQEVD